ncbi:MAG: ABC transporter permease, partial [Chloroflexi bacterium]|nr:ABC transporter permease [Chloroflexota bacterium]
FAIFSILVIAIFAPLIAPFEHDQLFVGGRAESPSWDHWLGTDILGRDVMSRVIFGARISMYVGFVAVIISTAIGAFIGLVTGYFQGALDLIVQRFIDAINSFPPLILALGIIAIRGASINNALIVITIVLIPGAARIIRGAVLSVKQNAYVDASLALGATDQRIIFRHILPNVVAPIIVNASILLGAAILFEASLSFLGAGAKNTDPSWGAMISGRAGTGVDQTLDFQLWPWIAIVPAASISIAVFSFNLLGDALRDLLDPRLRGSGGRLT